MQHNLKSVVGKALRFTKDSPRLQFFDNFQAVGGQLWPAGDVLVNYLAQPLCHNIVQNANVLELGSGCGYVGIACGALGAQHVTLTDRLLSQKNLSYDMEGCLIEECEGSIAGSSLLLDIMKDNIKLNREQTTKCSFAVHELQWGGNYFHLLDIVQASCPMTTTEEDAVTIDKNFSTKSGTYDVIVGSDLTYHSEITTELFTTVGELLDRNKRVERLPRFITSHQHRLDKSTRITLDAAKKIGLQKKDLWVGDSADGHFSIWEFTLPA